MATALEDEETSINAIYPDSLLKSADNHGDYTLSIAAAGLALRLSFPPDYPDSPPSILGSASSGTDLKKGQASQVVDLARQALADRFEPGVPCIFDLLQEMEERLPDALDNEQENHSSNINPVVEEHDNISKHQPRGVDAELEALDGASPPWALSEAVTEKKSVFVARAAAVSSQKEAQLYIQHLLATDKKAAKATHNMTAWRIKNGTGDTATWIQDCDDDGETAAGGRLLHLLQLMDACNVVVVVTRWYGGVHLGPDRFRLINQTARDALVQGGFTGPATEATSGKKKHK